MFVLGSFLVGNTHFSLPFSFFPIIVLSLISLFKKSLFSLCAFKILTFWNSSENCWVIVLYFFLKKIHTSYYVFLTHLALCVWVWGRRWKNVACLLFYTVQELAESLQWSCCLGISFPKQWSRVAVGKLNHRGQCNFFFKVGNTFKRNLMFPKTEELNNKWEW